MASVFVIRFCSTSVLKPHLLRQLPKQQIYRTFANNERESISGTARKATLRERVMAPTTGMPFKVGQGALAGGSLLGIGALCYYGLGLAKEPGALERSVIWPQFVKERIKATYTYFGGSLVITAASAMAAFRTPVIMNLVSRNGFWGIALSLAAMMGTGMLAQSIEYKPGFGAKQMAWMLHSGVLGAMLAPMCIMGGPILIRAAWYTAGIVGGLSTIAICAPSERFLNMGGPLAMGLGVVFVSSIGSMFLPPATALGAGLYSISLYGGLLLFSGFLLYDTQKIIAHAEKYPASPQLYGYRAFDPVNASIGIYLDTLNIFIRVLMVLAGQQQRGK